MLYRKDRRSRGGAGEVTQDPPEWLRSGNRAAAAAAQTDGAADGRFLLIVQGENGPEVVWCEDMADACTSVETMIGEGRDRESIEIVRASRVPFEVSYRPVVDLEVS